MSPAGGTRAALVLQKPRGRPGLAMADIQRRVLAVDMVNQLVAKGEKKDWSVIEVSKRMGISRSELYRWLKLEREFNFDLGELYPE